MIAAFVLLVLLLVPHWSTAAEIVVPNAQTSTVGNAAENDRFGGDHSFSISRSTVAVSSAPG